ncbi:uncharacterized protein C9orf57 homolog [Sapajus apella]|uniref:Uncharacterized protein C9orf57 homolog n=1 Tax=Sapajus apella TaxID=9515 RepID=A0A6J3IVU9_SAPAP|nr:uncharacterized protein C9orf57 homolog [Sapajus apella]
MRRIVFAGGIILSCLLGGKFQKSLFIDLSSFSSPSYLGLSPYFSTPVLGDIGGMICRACNLSIPFHGCLLDLGTCKTKPGQYCIKEVHIKGERYADPGGHEMLALLFLNVDRESSSQMDIRISMMYKKEPGSLFNKILTIVLDGSKAWNDYDVFGRAVS